MSYDGQQLKGDATQVECSQQVEDEQVFVDVPLGEAWGQSITQERANDLEAQRQQWAGEAVPCKRQGPFEGIRLTGADVFWLVARTLTAKQSEPLTIANAARWLLEYDVQSDDACRWRPKLNLCGAYLSGANLSEAHLLTVDLSNAHLIHVNLSGAVLHDVNLSHADLVAANCSWAVLETVNLAGATMHMVNLGSTRLHQSDLSHADLSSADMSGARLDYVNLSEAVLHDVTLSRAHLDKVDLSGTSLCGARFGVETSLSNATVSATTRMADVIWHAVPLTRIAWETLRVVGDETMARQSLDEQGKKKTAAKRIDEYETAVRAYRLLAVTLRSQGLNEHADRYAYRAQLMQRVVLRRQKKIGAYLFSLLLAALTGYGFRLERIFIAYLVSIFGFAALFLGGYALRTHSVGMQDVLNAIVLSLKAFHQQGFDTIFSPRGALTFAEALTGLVIESTFIAMLVQRLRAGSGD
jgi:uncharacterized protein YjbI with pentapeptide repeats